MSRRKIAKTVHGEVSYETVECASCGNEVAKEHAEDFIIGNIENIQTWHHKGTEYEIPIESRWRGYVCEFCRDDPARYPTDESSWRPFARTKIAASLTSLAALAWLAWIVATVVV